MEKTSTNESFKISTHLASFTLLRLSSHRSLIRKGNGDARCRFSKVRAKPSELFRFGMKIIALKRRKNRQNTTHRHLTNESKPGFFLSSFSRRKKTLLSGFRNRTFVGAPRRTDVCRRKRRDVLSF